MFDRDAIQRKFDETAALYTKARSEIGQATSAQDWDEREAELYQLSRELRSLKAQLDTAS
jgi:hypothetical protein